MMTQRCVGDNIVMPPFDGGGDGETSNIITYCSNKQPQQKTAKTSNAELIFYLCSNFSISYYQVFYFLRYFLQSSIHSIFTFTLFVDGRVLVLVHFLLLSFDVLIRKNFDRIDWFNQFKLDYPPSVDAAKPATSNPSAPSAPVKSKNDKIISNLSQVENDNNKGSTTTTAATVGILKPSNSIKTKLNTTTTAEAYFVLSLGLLLSLNSGYINGLCLGGLLAETGSPKQGVSAFTGTYTKSGLALASGNVQLFQFEMSLILAFVFGAFIAGMLNPQAIPQKLDPSYGPTFLIGACCMVAAAICAEVNSQAQFLYYFAAIANGLQNGMTSTYTANLIRTSHLTGTSTDIGLIAGRMLRGNWKDYWKFKVLVGLASAFWLGGIASFYSASKYFGHSLWFSAGLYSVIGFTHLLYIAVTRHVGFVQSCVGSWEGETDVIDRIMTMMLDGEGFHGGFHSFRSLLPEHVETVFGDVDSGGFTKIDGAELMRVLGILGVTVSEKDAQAMVSLIDENGDGVVECQELHALVYCALKAAREHNEWNVRKGYSKSSSKIGSEYIAPKNNPRVDKSHAKAVTMVV